MTDVQRFIESLEALSQDLNDAAMATLSEAIVNGKRERPELEKRLSQARRSVDKAIHQLRAGSEVQD